MTVIINPEPGYLMQYYAMRCLEFGPKGRGWAECFVHEKDEYDGFATTILSIENDEVTAGLRLIHDKEWMLKKHWPEYYELIVRIFGSTDKNMCEISRLVSTGCDVRPLYAKVREFCAEKDIDLVIFVCEEYLFWSLKGLGYPVHIMANDETSHLCGFSRSEMV